MKAVVLTPEQLAFLVSVFNEEKGEVILFGSRAKGTAQPFSDVDVCIKRDQPVPWEELAKLQELLSESNFPFVVDLSDFHSLPPFLQETIEKEGVPLTRRLSDKGQNSTQT